jgi:hypothetical protein
VPAHGPRAIQNGLVIDDEFSLINPSDGSRSLTLTYRVYNQARKKIEADRVR